VNSLKDVQVISLKRRNGQQVTLENSHEQGNINLILQPGDTFVLSGKPEALDLVEKRLVYGS
jgi:hypothetical protein